MKELKLYGERLITGAGSLAYIKELKEKRIFIVTGGKSVFENGAMDRMKDYLDTSNKTYEVFSGIPKNPDTSIVEAGLKAMKAFDPDLVLAIGGGSPIDAAKVMALMLDLSLDRVTDLQGMDIAKLTLSRPFVAVPTTSGTGTEVTKAAVITFKEDNIKIGLKSEAFIPTIAILDAELTLSMPKHIVAETGLDALTHALECYLNHNLDDYTECLAKGAIEGLFKYLSLSYETGSLEAREKVHHYQSIAGMAFHNVGLGMSHGISHAFGGQYDMGHGLLNGICLPYVLKFNSRDERVKTKLDKLSKTLGMDIIEGVIALNRRLDMPLTFREAGLSPEAFEQDFESLVDNSLKGSTVRNPAPITRGEMATLLKEIYA